MPTRQARRLFPWGETPRLAPAKLTMCGHVIRCGQFSPLVSPAPPRRRVDRHGLAASGTGWAPKCVKHSLDWDQIECKWKQLTGSARERCGQLADDNVQTLTGTKDHLVGKLQERYGIAKEEAEKQAEQWSHALKVG